MAKGPLITDEVRVLIASVYLEHPDWRAKEIQLEVNKKINFVKRREVGWNWPGLSVVQKILTDMRRRAKEGEEAGKGLEAPWSLGALAQYNIPPEANQDLMKIWKWCTVVGLTLTIREAQWVARLRGVVEFDFLYSCAIPYAMRERVCQLLGQREMVTHDLDIGMTFWAPPGTESNQEEAREGWLAVAAYVMGILRWSRDIIPEAVLEGERRKDYWDKERLSDVSVPTGRIVEEYLALEPQHTRELSENADMVYSLFLRRLATGPKWHGMSKEAKERIAERLYRGVKVLDEKWQGQKYVDLQDEDMDMQQPWPLFAEVGLSLDSATLKAPLASYESERAGKRPPFKSKPLASESKEDSDERSHNQKG